jgi:type-F conjugative transfer system pilin assembly protein TrbC
MKKLLVCLVLALSPVLVNAAGDEEPLEKSLRPLMNEAGNIEVILPEDNPEATQAAEALFRLYQSDAFQAKILKERNRLAEKFFGAKQKGVEDDNPKTDGDGGPATNDRISLFVSSSVPLPTLRNYAMDMARLKDPRLVLVMRGFVGGANRIGPTASFIAEVLKADPNCELGANRECPMREIPFIVDPTLFREAGIEKVPAIGFIPGGNQMIGEPLIIYGDTSLGYALERMARESGSKDLEQLAAKLKPIP